MMTLLKPVTANCSASETVVVVVVEEVVLGTRERRRRRARQSYHTTLGTGHMHIYTCIHMCLWVDI